MLLERENELAAIDGLLEAAADRAAAEGMRVLSARGFELERQFTFGVVRQLFEPAGADAALIDEASRSGADPLFAVAHGTSAPEFRQVTIRLAIATGSDPIEGASRSATRSPAASRPGSS